ncbi:MAG TPA: hypothetical protein VHE12_11520 [bacterium]|nr:hypothetical protein [bacterium]
MRPRTLLPLVLLFLFFRIPADGEKTPVVDVVPLEVSPQVIKAQPTPTRSEAHKDLPLEEMGPEMLLDHPWLNDLYSWGETFDLDHQEVKAANTGAYCIGNGRSFALVGLSSPLWSWSNLYGASYQEPDLGAMKMDVTRAGNDFWCPKQEIGWVKRSGVVRVRAVGKGILVETYDFAPARANESDSWDNPPVLVRLVHIQNNGDQDENDLDIQLKIQSAWNVKIHPEQEGHELVWDQKAQRAKKRTIWRMGSFNPKRVRIWDGNLHYGIESLKPGQETWTGFYLLSAGGRTEAHNLAEDVRKKGAVRLLDETRDYFTRWFDQGTTFSGDAKIADLFEIESMIFKSQQSYSGGFSPLIGYSYTWIRDNNGPIRWFLKTGHPKEAKGAMDFFYGVGSTMGSLPNSIRVDYPLDYRKKDLSNIHVEHAETPNWIVLQHWWYYLATGDLELIRARWNYLVRCIKGQVNEDDQYFFHRDETYLWCLESRCFDEVPFPNYYLSTYAFSTDSSFDLVSAADHLAYLGKYLEMDREVEDLKKLSQAVRDKAESTYWDEKHGYWAPAQSLLGPLYNAPFANILVNPLWCGYARGELDPLGPTPLSTGRAVSALWNAYPWLGRPDGFWKTTPTVDFFVGMNPGQLLYDFCEAHLAWAGKAYQAVLKAATPSGEFAEMYDGDYRPWNPPVWGVGTSGRVRPWEGGLNTESVLEYLTGFEPDAGNNRLVLSPHLPEDMKELDAQRFWVGPVRVSLALKRTSSREWTATLHLDRGEQIGVVMDLWADHRRFRSVEAAPKVEWRKSLEMTEGREALCETTLEADKDLVFTIQEGGTLSDSEIDPPGPQTFKPDPYETESGDVLLLTTPTGVFQQHKHARPERFLETGREELRLMKGVTKSLSFLDLDLPIAPEDIVNGLLDAKGANKVKLAVLGRGAFSSGKHDFKPEIYWTHPKLWQGIKKFLEQGGVLFLGPSYPDREVLPQWVVNLTGGWEEGLSKDKALAINANKVSSIQTKLDELPVNDKGAEEAHGVSVTGETFEDQQTLPDLQDEKKMIQEHGRGFSGYYQFTMRTVPGKRHRLWLRVNTAHNIKGMALQVQQGDGWTQVGVRTQNLGETRHFESLYFDVPDRFIISERTTFRLVSKNGEEVNAYRLWMYAVEGGRNESLPEMLGFGANQDIGSVVHGLIPKGKDWKVPVVLAQHGDQGAVILQKVGNGFLIRSELSMEDSVPIFKALLSPGLVEDMRSAWDKF